MRSSTDDAPAPAASSTPAAHTVPERGLGAFLMVGGLVGLLAAAVLLVERIAMVEDPDHIPTCSLNPVLSCGSVMTTAQASVFGFPNPILGVAGFAALAAVGAALLAGGVFRGWFWAGLLAGATFGIGFVHWLVYQSLYVIGALCPYCMVVWAVTIPVFVIVATHVARLRRPTAELTGVLGAVVEYRAVIVTAWYLVIVALIAVRFWSYWSTLV